MYRSEMSKMRAMARRAESDKRRALKHKMNPYNRLSARSRSKPSDFDYNPDKTIQDILFEFEQTVNTHKEHITKATNSLLTLKAVMSEELKDYWRQRIEHGAIKFDGGKKKEGQK
jgi:hypothetical protein